MLRAHCSSFLAAAGLAAAAAAAAAAALAALSPPIKLIRLKALLHPVSVGAGCPCCCWSVSPLPPLPLPPRPLRTYDSSPARLTSPLRSSLVLLLLEGGKWMPMPSLSRTPTPTGEDVKGDDDDGKPRFAFVEMLVLRLALDGRGGLRAPGRDGTNSVRGEEDVVVVVIDAAEAVESSPTSGRGDAKRPSSVGKGDVFAGGVFDPEISPLPPPPPSTREKSAPNVPPELVNPGESGPLPALPPPPTLGLASWCSGTVSPWECNMVLAFCRSNSSMSSMTPPSAVVVADAFVADNAKGRRFEGFSSIVGDVHGSLMLRQSTEAVRPALRDVGAAPAPVLSSLGVGLELLAKPKMPALLRRLRRCSSF